MIRACNAAEAAAKKNQSNKGNKGNKGKPPPPSRPAVAAAGRTLSALTGLPSKGTQQHPICLNDKPPSSSSSSLSMKNQDNDNHQSTSSSSLKRARPKMKAETVLAQARQRAGGASDGDSEEVAKIPSSSSQSRLKQPPTKRPSLRNQPSNNSNLAATSSTRQKHPPSKAATGAGGALSSILLSNQSTAKYLAKDAPKLLKHYPKITPDDYWKNLRSWDFIRELNSKMSENKAARAGGPTNTNNNSNKNKRKREEDKRETDASSAKPKEQSIKPIPDKFSSHREYCALWSPLLMMETRAQLLSDAVSDIPYWRSKVEKQPIRVKLEVRKKDLEGDHDAIGLVVKQVVKGDGGKEYKERMFMANDVVCLVSQEKMIWDATKGNLLSNNDNNNNTKQSSTCCIIGHLEHTRRSIENLVITISRKVWKEVGAREMTFLKIGCNITSLREYTALCRMDRLPLADYILCSKMNVQESDDEEEKQKDASSTLDNVDYDGEKQTKKEILQKMGGPISLGKGFVDYARHKFNLSQLKGISASAAEYGDGGFTLVSAEFICYFSFGV